MKKTSPLHQRGAVALLIVETAVDAMPIAKTHTDEARIIIAPAIHFMIVSFFVKVFLEQTPFIPHLATKRNPQNHAAHEQYCNE